MLVNAQSITASADGSVDASGVRGVDPDLRVRPFFAEGSTMSIREFVVGALHNEMGLEASDDPDLTAARAGARVVTPSGMVLDGSKDRIESPPAPDPHNGNEIDPALVDHLEFYLLNYFKPALYKQTSFTERGRYVFNRIGCNSCHVPDLTISHDRRVADVETAYDPTRGIFNNLFATAVPLVNAIDDGSGNPPLKVAAGLSFLVRNIFTDFKRHDVGPTFYERNWDGTTQKTFLTRPLWGVGSTSPYGHDGRSVTLSEVILRHGGEAQAERDAFAALTDAQADNLLRFLNSLVCSARRHGLDARSRRSDEPGFPQAGHGSIVDAPFNDPTDSE
jgi:CxxC motif-containing protein (DUF1111 family)